MSVKKVLVKFSGEVLAQDDSLINQDILKFIAQEISILTQSGVSVGIVVGGGNIIRGVSASKDGLIKRVSADYMGMLSTAINALALQAALEHHGHQVRLMTAIMMAEIGEPFIIQKALRHLERQRVVVFACGTGRPYYSTDSAATLRAIELDCQMLIKATKVNGIYDKDPAKFSEAVKLNELSYEEAIAQNIQVMDQTAITMARENRLPIGVCAMRDSGSLLATFNKDLNYCSILT